MCGESREYCRLNFVSGQRTISDGDDLPLHPNRCNGLGHKQQVAPIAFHQFAEPLLQLGGLRQTVLGGYLLDTDWISLGGHLLLGCRNNRCGLAPFSDRASIALEREKSRSLRVIL